MNMRPYQILVRQIETWWTHCSGYHEFRVAEEILIVRRASGAVGKYQGGLPAASRSPATLRVVGRRRRNVAKVDCIELSDVHAQLHRR